MKSKAALLTLVLVSGTLAGCTSDPDGGGNDEIDAETLQNLQDLINGTMEPEWINDRGDSGHQWTLSLNDDQWLEVASAYAVIQDTSYGGEDRNTTWYAMMRDISLSTVGSMNLNPLSLVGTTHYASTGIMEFATNMIEIRQIKILR